MGKQRRKAQRASPEAKYAIACPVCGVSGMRREHKATFCGDKCRYAWHKDRRAKALRLLDAQGA